MALQQNTVIDLIQIVENGIIQIRQRIDVYDDSAPSNIIASNFHRYTLNPGDDVSSQTAQIQAIANAIWTQEVISAYQTMISQQKPNKE